MGNFELILCYGDGAFAHLRFPTRAAAEAEVEKRNQVRWWRIIEHRGQEWAEVASGGAHKFDKGPRSKRRSLKAAV